MMYSHGWLLPDENDNYNAQTNLNQYKKTLLPHEYEIICFVNVCEDADGFFLSGEFGILWLECMYGEGVMPPYDYEFLQDMLAALEMAEDDLLMIGIPFCTKYKFHGKNAANKKRRNDALRRKYKCDEIEKELGKQLMLKRKQEQERRKNAHENNVE